MSRKTRKNIIGEIEKIRDSRVLSYVTGDRQPTQAQIGDDAIRPIYEQLRNMGHVSRLDVYIYSRGGAIDVPWRLANAFRTTADEWNILIPFRANSGATLLALGADEIKLGQQGELGPIDPIMNIQRLLPNPSGGQGTVVQDNISVEDVMAYVKFLRDRAGLSDQDALTAGVAKLAERLDAVALGNAYRTHSHIRDVARRMLLSRANPANEQTMATIIETLAERVYAHGHAIGLNDAIQIGLPASRAEPELDDAMWRLLNEYESDLKLLEPIDPAIVTAGKDLYTEQSVIAVVETSAGGQEMKGEAQFRAMRQIPPNLNVALNLNVQVPPGLQPAQAQATQAFMQQLQQNLLKEAQAAVQQALKDQAPIIGYDAGLRGARWEAAS